jgi:hypothetical protein
MAEIEAAIERLEHAVARLEAARGAAGHSREVDDARRNEIATEIAARVDRALGRIRRVLGEGGRHGTSQPDD